MSPFSQTFIESSQMDLSAGVLANFIQKHPGRRECVNKTVDDWSTKLWSVAWGKHDGKSVFELRDVERDSAASSIILDVPKQCWVLKGAADEALSTFDVKDAFIRDEYFKAIRNILSYMQTGTLIDTPDKDTSTAISSPPGRDHNAMDQDPPPFPNPFLNYKPGHRAKDVILTGNPGLGMVVQRLLQRSNALSFCCREITFFARASCASAVCWSPHHFSGSPKLHVNFFRRWRFYRQIRRFYSIRGPFYCTFIPRAMVSRLLEPPSQHGAAVHNRLWVTNHSCDLPSCKTLAMV